MARMTQLNRVVQYMMDFGSISSLEAFRELGVTRLSAVIFKLKERGYIIDTKLEKSTNRYGESVYFARYSFKEHKHDNKV